MYCVQNLTFTGNRLESTEAYPQWKPDAPRFGTPDGDNVLIEDERLSFAWRKRMFGAKVLEKRGGVPVSYRP